MAKNKNLNKVEIKNNWDQAEKDWKAKKITQEQFKKILKEISYNDSFAELIISDIEDDDMVIAMENMDQDLGAAFEAARSYLVKYGKDRGY